MSPLAKGIAFAVEELLTIQAWATRHAVRMTIRLDHGVDDEEYEEVVALRADAASWPLLMWRDEQAVFIQPLPGRQLRFASVAEALARLPARQGAPVHP